MKVLLIGAGAVGSIIAGSLGLLRTKMFLRWLAEQMISKEGKLSSVC